MKADVPPDTKTGERTKDAAAAVQAKHGDSCSANQVDPDPMCLTSFSDDSTGPSTLPCSRDDSLVGNCPAAPKSCVFPLEIRTATVTTAARTTFGQPPLWFYSTEGINLKTSNQYTMDYIN